MKNLCKPLLIFIFLIPLVSCKQNQEKPPTEVKEEVLTAPEQIIPLEEARKFYHTYGKRRVPLIQHYEDSINRYLKNQKIENTNFDVGRYVYYDYQTIKDYIEYIEKEASKANVEISTLRFYFSNYPDETFFPNTKDSIAHPRQNSIIISPTYMEGKRNRLFYVRTYEDGKSRAIPLLDNFENIEEFGATNATGNKSHASFAPNLKKSNAAQPLFFEEVSLTMNRGNGVPPPEMEQ